MSKTILILIFLASSTILLANDLFFQHFGLNDGLSSNVVFGIAEDKNGLLWIATTEGVDKFDGIKFRHYTLPELKTNKMFDYMEYFVKSDSKGNIWLATKNGLIYLLNTYYDKFELVYRFPPNKDANTAVRLNAFFVDHNDDLLVSINSGVWYIKSSNFKSQKLSDNGSVYSIVQDSKNHYYWSDHEGVLEMDTSFQHVRSLIPESIRNATNLRISKIFIDNMTETLWGVSSKEGIFSIHLPSLEFKFPKKLRQYSNLVVRSFYQYSDTELLIGVDGLGLVLWNNESEHVVREVVYNNGKLGTLSSNAIYDIFKNSDGIYFISTHRGGINVYNPHKMNFGYINSVPNNPKSLSSNYSLSFKEISKGVIGFGTYEGISIWNKSKNSWQHLADADEKVSEVILSFALDKNKDIWATSFTNSLMHHEYINGKYYNSKNLLKNLKIRSRNIHIDSQNNVWISDHRGVYKYNVIEQHIERVPIEGVLVLKGLPNDILALGSENGLSFINTKTFKLHNYDFIDNANREMRIVRCLRVDSLNRLWVGTKIDGVYMIDFNSQLVKNITTTDGLPVNHIFGIAVGKKHVWISTLKGISRIDDAFNVVNYTRSDGIVSIDFNYDATLCDSDGMLYFGTNDGVITLNPSELSIKDKDKKIILSELKLNHRRVIPGDDSPLTTEANAARLITLNHNQNSFSLRFECVDFLKPGRGTYRWKLENFDTDWLASDQLPEINYANLEPGNYMFKVKVLDERGNLISNEKNIVINVLKPWWSTYWAFIIYTLLIGLALWGLAYLNRLWHQSKISSERLGFLINLAHELKTPLLLIKAPLNDLLSKEDISGAVRKNVNIALSSAERLHKQMIDFLDMGNLSKIESRLKMEHMDLIRFINEKLIAFRVFAEKKNIKLSVKYQMEDFKIKMDGKILDKILSNLISNAIKYTNAGGTVSIEHQVRDNECKILVTDSGIGILKSEQKNIFKPFYRTERAKQSGSTGNGMGLVLAANLAKMLNGRLSLLESTDHGTTFEFKFPYEFSKEKEAIDSDEEALESKDMRTKLLLVEDDEELLEYSIGKLEKYYQVSTAKNGLEAIERCKEMLPNVIISDVVMPQMSGLQLCMKLKADVDTSHIPVILFTGLDSKEEIMEGLEAGADDYIIKPFEFDILIKKVDTLLNNRLILQKKFLYQTEAGDEVGFSSKLDDEWISEVEKFVMEHIEDSELTPSDLYKQFGMSRSAFYHKTKTLVDLSPIELIRTIRLKKAKSLLGSSNSDISEVAYQLGFNDPKYFSTIFKRYFGQTPSAFIAKKRALIENSES